MLQFVSRTEKDSVVRVIIVPEHSAGLTVAALITYQQHNYIVESHAVKKTEDEAADELKIVGPKITNHKLSVVGSPAVKISDAQWIFNGQLVGSGDSYTPEQSGAYVVKVFLTCPDGTVDVREMLVHVDQFAENEINKILHSFQLYYQCQNTPILAVGGTCAVYSRSFRELEGITTKWVTIDADGTEAEIKQSGNNAENTYVDFVSITEDMVDKKICVRISYQSKVKQFVTPTSVQHELNVEREFEHEFMIPQQSLAVNYL